VSHVSTDWVRVNAERYGDSPALWNVETDERSTWRQLDDRVGRLAGVFADSFHLGVGDRVLVLAEGDTRTFEVQFACMRLGAVMVPLNWRLAVPELLTLARDAEPALIIHDDVWQAVAEEISETLGITGRLNWRCGSYGTDYETALAGARMVEPRSDLPLGLPSHLLHTSGTTGRPKGALTTHETLVWQTLNTAADAGMTGPGRVLLNPMPLFHAGGLTTVATPMLLTGGAVATMRRFDPAAVLDLLGDPTRGITHFTAPPVMWLMLSDESSFESADFSALHFAQVAGGLPALDLLATWRSKGVVLRAAYGGTELGPSVTTMPLSHAESHPTSCGRAVPCTHVRLVDDGGHDVPAGAVGEIWVKGPSVTPGYWRGSAEQDSSWVDGWFRSGDAAYRDDDGFYYLVDRVKDMYKSGGENIAPAEVERVIATHPDVIDVAVIGIPDRRWGEVGRAYVVVRDGSVLTLEAVREHCSRSIARYKAPRSVVIVDELPRNSTGKIMRAALRQQAQPGD
jgi:fatty-acyl-CoA synthase